AGRHAFAHHAPAFNGKRSFGGAGRRIRTGRGIGAVEGPAIALAGSGTTSGRDRAGYHNASFHARCKLFDGSHLRTHTSGRNLTGKPRGVAQGNRKEPCAWPPAIAATAGSRGGDSGIRAADGRRVDAADLCSYAASRSRLSIAGGFHLC